MVYSKIRNLYDKEDLGLLKLSKEERKQVLKDTFLWLPGYKERLRRKIENILEEKKHTRNCKNTDNIGKNQNNTEKLNHGSFNLPPEDSDEYIPQDMEMGESLGEGPHIFEISPYLPGYYIGGKKSYFDKNRLIWSKRKKLGDFNKKIDKTKRRFNFAGKIGKGLFSIPLPRNSFPDIDSLVSNTKGLKFKIDQNNCIYLESQSVGEFSFDLYIDQFENNNKPVIEDSEKIIRGNLSQKTNNLLNKLKTENKSNLEIANFLKIYINSGKKYNEKAQGEIFGNSNKNNYFENLDKAQSLECYSANTLFIGLLRELGIKSRLIVGHHIQQKGKNGKGNIGQNTGHAWSEVWDEDKGLWIRLDATPLIREKDDNDSGKSEGNDNRQDGENLEDGNNQDGGDNKNSESEGKSESGESGEQGNGAGEEEQKSAEDILEEIIKKVREDDFNKQKEELDKNLEKVNTIEDKNELKKILEETDLTDKAKDILEDEINNKILKQEKNELKDLEKENDIDEQLEKSILEDDEFKKKLKKYAKDLKKKIEEEKKRKEIKMKNYGFNKEELALYNEYIELEKELQNDIKINIRKLEKILPKEYKIVEDESMYFSGKQIDKSKLVKYRVTGDSRIFKRNVEEIQNIKVNMFETILIDRSLSMGSFEDKNSPLRNAIKAAIIRARTLEYFKVDFSIVFFDNDIEEIMTFGEKFGSKKTMIPAKLMRAAKKSGGTNISLPIIYTKEKLTEFSKKQGKRSLGNITFIGDGKPMGGFTGDDLKQLIDDTKKKFPITAFYITGGDQNRTELERYFGNKESGGTVVIDDVSKLSKGIVDTFNKNIKKTLRKIQKIK